MPEIAMRAFGSMLTVIAIEREEGAELHPPRAKVEVGVARETAGIGAKHGHPAHHERQSLSERISKVFSLTPIMDLLVRSHLRYRQEHRAPGRRVVAAPMAGEASTAGEDTASYRERALYEGPSVSYQSHLLCKLARVWIPCSGTRRAEHGTLRSRSGSQRGCACSTRWC